MATRHEWDEVITRILSEQVPLRSKHLGRLYELALSDGLRCLASYRATLGEERVVDLIHDLLAHRLHEIITADTPRAFFYTSLVNRARSWVRRGAAKVMESSPDSSRHASSDGLEEDLRAFVLDARAALACLSARDRSIVVAVAEGEDREEVARTHHTSRANVDQIVSRAQRRFRGDEP